MTAEIIAVGTEILLGDIVDTNAAELGKAFSRYGFAHHHRQSVGDNLDRLTRALRLALSRSDVVFTIGGLGPTEDDLTRDGIAAALGVPLILDEQVEAHIRSLFEKRGYPYTDSQSRQAMKPAGAEVVPNPRGTAPGLICRIPGKTVVAMPGPRNEFVPMLNEGLKGFFEKMSSGEIIHSRTLKFVGIGESMLEEQLRDLMQDSNPTVAPYAKTGEVHIRVTARAATVEDAEAIIEPAAQAIAQRAGRYLYGQDEETLAHAALRLLAGRGATLATVESCTGGGLGEFLTSVPGSSESYLGGFVTYSNAQKTAMVGVPASLLEIHGAVSEECAKAMAEGGRDRTGADYCLSITGVAGPGGGTDEKPVGLVFVACAGPEGTKVVRSQWMGTREAVRERAQKTALMLLRLMILKLDD